MPTPPPPALRSPKLVQAYYFARAQNWILDQARAKHGDVFQLNFERNRWNVLAHPDAVKEVFTAPATALHAGKGNEILATALGEHSVLILDEDEHMRQRRLLLPSFHGEKLASQTATIERISAEQVERMPRGKSFSLREHSQAIALEVILEVVLGTESRDLGLERCTVVAAPYFVGGARAGAVALLGPLRLEYARLVPLVNYTADSISGMLRGVPSAA